MLPIPIIVSVVSSSFVFGMSLFPTTQAAEKIRASDCAELKSGHRDLETCEENRRQGIDIVKGEVLDIEGDTYVVQRFYGKEVHLTTTARTQVTGMIRVGDNIEQ